MAHLPLVNRRGDTLAYAVVDDDDARTYSAWRWRKGATGYVERKAGARGSHRRIFLHREILGLPRKADWRQADHINRNKLDCRRANLRVVTVAENNQNRSKSKHGLSPYRGVTHDAYGWRATVTVSGNRMRRRFLTEEDAAQYAAGLRAELMPFSEDAAR